MKNTGEFKLTSRQMAEFLIKEMSPHCYDEYYDALDCALIAAQTHQYGEHTSPFPTINSWVEDDRYWKEVVAIIEEKINAKRY